MPRELQTCPHCNNRTVPMPDGTCPSCRKCVDEPQKIEMGFLGGTAAKRVVDVGPQPVALWKPVVSMMLAYVAIMILAVLTENLTQTAKMLQGVGLLAFFAAKLWLFIVIARGSIFAALCCACVPLMWVFFVSEHWLAARWPVVLGVMGVLSLPVSHYAFEVGRTMAL